MFALLVLESIVKNCGKFVSFLKIGTYLTKITQENKSSEDIVLLTAMKWFNHNPYSLLKSNMRNVNRMVVYSCW